MPKIVAASAVDGGLEALLGEGRTRDAATQPLEALAVAARHGRARVHVYATNFGERLVGFGDLLHAMHELAGPLPGCISQQLPVGDRGPVTCGQGRLILREQIGRVITTELVE